MLYDFLVFVTAVARSNELSVSEKNLGKYFSPKGTKVLPVLKTC